MIKSLITIVNKLGLHTRAAAKLVATASHYESKISITYKGNTVNCKSIMGVITLGAAKGAILEFEITGTDERDACDAIALLVSDKFNEAE
ncbi:MAG: HPr family phosphocarrier protein [Gammaproteobacteria bacterium]|nr:HPr family phosphocarrier protein [Gammaproteobacteria bacterium]